MAATQTDTLRLFTALLLFEAEWAGRLLVSVGLNDAGRTLALASVAAGAASLFLEAEERAIREASREGCCTFSVTSLDEALRILKNEIRQRRAVSVALHCEPADVLREMVERGVLPYALAASCEVKPVASLQTMMQWGAVCLHGFGLQSCSASSVELEDLLAASSFVELHIETDVASSLRERAQRDAELLAANMPHEFAPFAARWFAVCPQLFARSRERSYWAELHHETIA